MLCARVCAHVCVYNMFLQVYETDYTSILNIYIYIIFIYFEWISLRVYTPLHVYFWYVSVRVHIYLVFMYVSVDKLLNLEYLFCLQASVWSFEWASQLKFACSLLYCTVLTTYAHSDTLTHRPPPLLFFYHSHLQPFPVTLSSPLFYHKVFMCLISFSTCRLHVSGRCGVSSSWDCRTVSLFSFQICSSTHQAAASGSTLADWRCSQGHLT